MSETPTKKLLFTLREAAEALDISRGTVYRMVSDKRLPSLRVGGVLRVPVADLERWIASRTKGGADAQVDR